MRAPLWMHIAAALLLPACAMGVDEPADEDQDLITPLGMELGLEGLDPDECPGKPGLPVETQLKGLEELPPDTNLPVVVELHVPSEPSIVGEAGKRPPIMASQIDAQYLEAYPHFDDCNLPGQYCW